MHLLQAEYMEQLLKRLSMGVVRLWSDMSTAAEIPYGTGCIVCTLEKASIFFAAACCNLDQASGSEPAHLLHHQLCLLASVQE